MEIPERNSWKIAENRTLKVQVPPEEEIRRATLLTESNSGSLLSSSFTGAFRPMPFLERPAGRSQ
jgi:hypothetical protein